MRAPSKLSLLLLAVVMSAAAQSGRLENGAVAWTWQVSGGRLNATSLVDKLNGTTQPLGGEPFELVLSDGTVLKASQLSLRGMPRVERLAADLQSPIVSRHEPGEALVARWEAPREHLAATWRVILRRRSTYVREELSLRALGGDAPLRAVVLFDDHVAGAQTVGSVDGSPVVAGNDFFGYEQPMAQNTVTADGLVRCAYVRNAVIQNGETLRQSLVVGVVHAGQLRRDFLAYVERERAHPYRPFLHYNSWYDLRDYSQAEAVAAIRQIGDELTRRRGVPLAAYLFDDGWDDPKTLWHFSPRLPHGFQPLRQAAARYGAGLGVWISPFGGYGAAKRARIEFGKAQGFETDAAGFSLAGPHYYRRFHDMCVTFMEQDGVSAFKFDGLAAGEKASEAGLTRDGDAMLRLIGQLRALRPDLFISQTVGTWPSPFWLLAVDSTWRGGNDHDFYGAGSPRQRWITYRDMETYRNVVERAPLYPLNSLMLHGIILGRQAEGLQTTSDQDFADEVWKFFGSGTQLQELYLTPALLNQRNWDDLAAAASWARANADVLVDTHWIGGDPGKGQVYGWASWSPSKAVLVLRNPADKPETLTLDAGTAFELPAGARRKYTLRSPWKPEQGMPAVRLEAGKPYVFTLQPFQVLVLEQGRSTRQRGKAVQP